MTRVEAEGITAVLGGELGDVSAGEESGTPCVAVNGVDIRRHTGGEGGALDCN